MKTRSRISWGSWDRRVFFLGAGAVAVDSPLGFLLFVVVSLSLSLPLPVTFRGCPLFPRTLIGVSFILCNP